MFKKTLLLLMLLFNLIPQINVFADSIPVENIFLDINSDYKYLNELQTLYDKGMMFPDSDGNFNPYQLLTREEFVGITMEVSCKKCIKPDVDYYFVDKYKSKPFYDVGLDNKYFYCISDAAENNYVLGYDDSTTCNDGTYLEGQNPFCVKNNIILEEAIAIILRVSGILSSNEANLILQDINNGLITENLSDDISPKNLDGSAYSFYPYFKKALDYEIVEYDENGDKSSYYMVEIVDGKLRPKKNINKEEFLRIAFVALKANNCMETNDANLSLEMNVYDTSCFEGAENCSLSSSTNVDIFDFEADVYSTCTSGINNPEGYIWRFYSVETGKEYKKYGKYIDDYNFENGGEWKVYLRVIDNCGNTSEVFNTINIVNNNDLLVSIDANPIYGISPLKVDLSGIVYGNNGPYSYEWDFGNGTKGFGKDQVIIYKNVGVYEVILKVTDKDGNIGIANVFIEVSDIMELNNANLDNDIDGDGILNGEDNDMDGDGTLNGEDNDMDGDGTLNGEDDDIDGDGILNGEDNDMDGDGTLNGEDDNIDGDGTLNGEDDNVDESITNLGSDSDFDGVNDKYDNCPLIDGILENNGCPILSETCSNELDCKEGFFCNFDKDNFGICELSDNNDLSDNNSNNLCNYNGDSTIYGNIICETCPCDNFLDYISTLRKCDTIFPAITSPDNSIIYSRGDFFQIK